MRDLIVTIYTSIGGSDVWIAQGWGSPVDALERLHTYNRSLTQLEDKGRYLWKGLQRVHLGHFRSLAEATPKMDESHKFFRQI